MFLPNPEEVKSTVSELMHKERIAKTARELFLVLTVEMKDPRVLAVVTKNKLSDQNGSIQVDVKDYLKVAARLAYDWAEWLETEHLARFTR